MSKMIYFYLIFPLFILILYFFSREEELPDGMEETGISRAFLKMSLFIYKRVQKRVKSFSSEKIRLYLGMLQQRKDLDRAETEYFIRKRGFWHDGGYYASPLMYICN